MSDIAFFWSHYWTGIAAATGMMFVLWLASIPLKNVSIVDLFWGAGFVLVAGAYLWSLDGEWTPRRILVGALVAVWGLRLSIYLTMRNVGHGEDFRYQKFRSDFGDGYWWYSLPSVFLLQGVLMWIISAPLLGAFVGDGTLGWIDYLGVAVWMFGFVFEAGSDWQLRRFKKDPANKGKLLTTGFWRYTRHPNYFGDATVWWGFGLFAVGAGSYFTVFGSAFMTALIIKVSGVALLETTMKNAKPGYEEYMRRTNAFLPWFPRKA